MIVRLATWAMGTRFELVLAGPDEVFLRAAGEEAIEEIELWHRRLSFFQRDSLVSRINERAADGWVLLDRETFRLLALAMDLHARTHGAFDVTVAPLMQRWGFRDATDRLALDERVWGSRHVELDEGRRAVRFARHGIGIDMGAIGKGWALDCAASVLRDHGVKCALLHGGTSTVIAIGAPPARAGWCVAIAGADDHPPIDLRDRALSVSAPHGRVVRRGGRTLGHVIDPRTGAPAEAPAVAAALHESAAVADAWSTALLVLGRVCPDLPGEVEAIIVGADADHLTPREVA